MTHVGDNMCFWEWLKPEKYTDMIYYIAHLTL